MDKVLEEVMEDKEAVYDTQIHPLILQIRELCKKNGMPHLLMVQMSGTRQRAPLAVTADNVGLYCNEALDDMIISLGRAEQKGRRDGRVTDLPD